MTAVDLRSRSSAISNNIRSKSTDIAATTLVIYTGITRNYDAAILSFPIFGNCDVAIVTWDNEDARDFQNFMNPEQLHLIDESEITFDRGVVDINCQKMLYLWTVCGRLLDVSKYTHIYITRPDIFVYSKEVLDAEYLLGHGDVTTPSAINLEGPSGINDQLILCTKNGFAKICEIANAILSLPPKSTYACIHSLLFQFFEHHAINSCNKRFLESVYDTVIQRDNFTLLTEDTDIDDIYVSILASAITWWRRTHKSKYGLNAQQIVTNLTRRRYE